MFWKKKAATHHGVVEEVVIGRFHFAWFDNYRVENTPVPPKTEAA